jgi:putative phosphoribosyl transferase
LVAPRKLSGAYASGRQIATPAFQLIGSEVDSLGQTHAIEPLERTSKTRWQHLAHRIMEFEAEVRIPAGAATLDGSLAVPDGARGIVLFAHGSGSSRHSPRNRFVAQTLNGSGLATLLFDLLTPAEEAVDLHTRQHRFDIGLLAERLAAATAWVAQESPVRGLRVGYFGSSTGGGGALVAAARNPEPIGAVVSRGGRPDLAGAALPKVQAPTLLIVGGADNVVIDLNREAMAQMHCEVKLELVPGATHLFEEPGTLEKVARLASEWFTRHLSVRRSSGSKPH